MPMEFHIFCKSKQNNLTEKVISCRFYFDAYIIIYAGCVLFAEYCILTEYSTMFYNMKSWKYAKFARCLSFVLGISRIDAKKPL